MTEEKAVIRGCYADYRRVKGRKVLQIIIEVPLEEAPRVHEAFGEPTPDGSTWVAVALLQPETSRVVEQTDKHRLSRQAAMLCDDPRFRAFLNEYSGCDDANINACAGPAGSAAMVRLLCGVDSRAEFDTNPEAAQKWRNLKASFEAWLAV